VFVQGNIGGATESLTPCSGNYATDVWYSFTATSSSARIFIDAEAYFNPVLEVFDACGGNSIACIDNNGLNYSESYYDTNFIPGHQYFIRVYGHNQFTSNQEFQITVTDSNVVTSTNNIFSDDYLKLYPNPSSGKIIVENTNGNYDFVKILSITGTVLLEQNIKNKTVIDVSGLKPGIYFVKIYDKTNNNSIIKRLVIK